MTRKRSHPHDGAAISTKSDETQNSNPQPDAKHEPAAAPQAAPEKNLQPAVRVDVPRDCLFEIIDEDGDPIKIYAITPAAPGWLRADAKEYSEAPWAGLWSDPMPIATWLTTSEGTFPVVVGETAPEAACAWHDAALISPTGEAFSSENEQYASLTEWLEACGEGWRRAAQRRAERAQLNKT